jgi:hypothetical protein
MKGSERVKAHLGILGVGVALLAATPAFAEVTTPDFDVKCVMVLNVALPQAKPEQKDELRSASFYYLGRLDARTPAIDLPAATRRLAPAFTQAVAEAHIGKCMTLLGRRVEALKATPATSVAKPAPRK